MCGGLGEGVLPLTIGYAQILHQPQGSLFAQAVPAVLMSNFVAVFLSGLLNYLGKKKPHLTGEGKLEPGEHDDEELLAHEKRSGHVDVRYIAAIAITAITFYLLGNVLNRLFGIPGVLFLILLPVAIKLAHMVSPSLQQGSTQLFKFFTTAVTFPILFAVSVSLIQWQQLVAGFALRNLITSMVVVIVLELTGLGVGRWTRMYPIEFAIINLCHSGIGASGDLAILTTANRMKLMPFGRIVTSIGGILILTIALLVMARVV
jgi:Na+/citrate or Na+/malate symporter